jgi:osmotically-inducible protein OsmY
MAFRIMVLAALGTAVAASACTPVGTAVGVGASAGTVAAQERPIGKAVSDAAIRAEINVLWAAKDLALFRKIDMSIAEGRVLLTGTVINPETRVEASRLAWQADGVKEVLNEIQVEDQSGLLDRARDGWIATKLRGRLLLDSHVKAVNYAVEVVNGTVYLMGIAQDQDELKRVIGHVRDTAYVRNYVNHVRMKDDPRRKGA